MDSTTDLTRLVGAVVVDRAGGMLGTAQEVYVDDATGRPEWVTVRAGLVGGSEAFVPLAGAEVSEDVLRVAYDKKAVKGAPRLHAAGHLTPEHEEDLNRYYGITPQSPGPTFTGPVAPPAPQTVTGATGARLPAADPGPVPPAGAPASTSAAAPAGGSADDSADGSGGTDGSMTRSEERLVVGTQRHAVERARLRKHVVTEMRAVEVQVRREEVRLEHVPAGGEGPDEGEPYDGPPVDVSDAQPVVVLHEERPVVTTETVPVERVRLVTDEVTTTQAVSGEVRTEDVVVETEGDVDVTGDAGPGAPGPARPGRGGHGFLGALRGLGGGRGRRRRS